MFTVVPETIGAEDCTGPCMRIAARGSTRRQVRVIAASASMITHPPNMIILRQDPRGGHAVTGQLPDTLSGGDTLYDHVIT